MLSSSETWQNHQLLLSETEDRISKMFWTKLKTNSILSCSLNFCYSANPTPHCARGPPASNRNQLQPHKSTITHQSCFIHSSSISLLIKATHLHKSLYEFSIKNFERAISGLFPSGRFHFRFNYILLIIEEEVRMGEKRNCATRIHCFWSCSSIRV